MMFTENPINISKKPEFTENKLEVMDSFKFFEKIKNNKEKIQETVYTLYNYIEPHLEKNKIGMNLHIQDSLRQIAESISTKVTDNISSIEEYRVEGDRLGSIANNKTYDPRLARKFDNYFNDIRTLSALESFDIYEIELIELKSEDTTPDRVFQIFNALCYVLNNLSEISSKKLQSPVFAGRFKYIDLFDLANAVRVASYQASKPTVDKLYPSLLKYKNNSFVDDQYNRMASINLREYEELISNNENQLSKLDYNILKLLKNNSLDGKMINFIISKEYGIRDNILNLEKIISEIHRAIWINQKVDVERKSLTQSGITNRKKIQKYLKENYAYYTEVYEEIYNSIENNDSINAKTNTSYENRTETAPSEINIYYKYERYKQPIDPESQKESKGLDQYLSTKDYDKFTSSNPHHTQIKITNVINFIDNNQDQCLSNMGIVLYTMKYENTLPFLPGQNKDMYFRNQNHPNCLKLDTPKGRILCYFDNESKLNVEYLTNQEYHNERI